MKIAFVRPAAPLNRYINNVPLNYIHLAAYLRERGHVPYILDMVLDEWTEEAVDAFLKAHEISIVGIGCMTCELPQAVEQGLRLKKAHPGLSIVFGGAHPSADPEECLRTGAADYVIVGEGEIALDGLLNAIPDRAAVETVPGVWSIRDGDVRESTPAPVPDIEALPTPAYDLLNLDSYFRLESPWHFPKSPKAVQFISSRGCPYRCSYCHTIHGKRFRGVSPLKVVDQIEGLVREFGIEELMIVDDIFNFDLERAKTICREIIRRGLRIHLQFPNGVRGDRFDEELVQLMKLAGGHYMAVAIETVSKEYQKLIRKNLKIEPALQTIHWARRHGIEVSGFFMIGFPGESQADVRKTLDFATNAPLDSIFISIVAPFKGTVLRNDILTERFGPMSEAAEAAMDQLFPVVHNDAVSAEWLEQERMRAYWRFYRRPRSILNLARRMTNRRAVRKLARAVGRRVLRRGGSSVN